MHPNERVPNVSIVMPVFNGSRYLGATLDSLRAQSFDAFEVLCVDDHSTDASFELLRYRAAEDPRIVVAQTPRNLGTAPRVINYILPRVRGRWFLYTSQDDLYSTDWLQEMLQSAEATGADAVMPSMEYYYERARTEATGIEGLAQKFGPVISGRRAAELSLDWSIHGFVLWRAELVRENGFREHGMFADEYTARELFLRCRTLAFSKGRFYYRQDNPNAITKVRSVGTFDKPFNHLMLARLVRRHGFGRSDVERQVEQALTDLVTLEVELCDPGRYPPDFVRRAEAKLRSCFDAMKNDEFRSALAALTTPKMRIRRAAAAGTWAQFRLACSVFGGVSQLVPRESK